MDSRISNIIPSSSAATWIKKMCAKSQNINRVGPILVSSMLCLTLIGCAGENVADLQDYVQKVKTRKKGDVPALPDVQSHETYTYVSSKLRDPFKVARPPPPPCTELKKGCPDNQPKPQCKKPRDVLEQFPLDSLKLMGSLEQKGQRWALVKAQDGTLYRTKKGNCMGQDNGKIVDVTDTEIVLKEIVSDGLGGYVERKTVLSVTQ